ncbi:MAG: 2-oxoglutarate dehydrogenase complex dihydrolipoyllysine-residue succinyltransferase [Myxococcota bacterium]
MATDVTVPELGESITEGTVLEWLVEAGERVEVDQDIVALETDKITVNVPAPVGGVLLEQVAAEGEDVEVGAVVARIDESGTAEAKPSKKEEHAAKEAPAEDEPAAQEAPAEAKPAAKEAVAKGKTREEGAEETPMMPAVRRMVREHGLDPSGIEGTGRGGRILKEDVQRHLEGAKADEPKEAEEEPKKAERKPVAAPTPKPPARAVEEGDEREDIVPMSKLRRRIAENLVQVQQNAALLTTFNEADMGAVMALRKRYKDRFKEKYGIKLGFMSFFAKAAIEALKEFPAVNAEIRDQNIVYKNHYDIGIAVGGGRGLVVPVIRDADRLSFADFEWRLAEVVDKAMNNRLALDDLQGGTFTISNGGVYGSMLSTPILNPPQSGILGLHKIQERPMAVDGEVVIRPMMYLALTYDHRIIDGREAVQFLTRVKECIEDPERLLVEV